MASQVMLYQLSAYCISDIGLVRQNNEDAWKILKDEQFFVLADGMGGHQAGEIASKETVEQLCRLFQQRLSCFRKRLDEAKECMQEIIQEVNAIIYRLSKENPQWRGMGTTLCCIFFHSEGLIYGHVGDSRIYRFRNHKLEKLTQDHSLLQELIELGQLSEQQAGEFLYKNIITKAIGTEAHVKPTIAQTAVEVGDIFLLCSDGLSDLVNFKEIETIMDHYSEEDAATLLVKEAKQHGGHDNITVIVVKVLGKNEAHLS